MSKFEGFADLPAVDSDAINVKNGFKGLGAKPTNITVFEDTNFDDLLSLFKDLRQQAETNWTSNCEHTFIFIYYAGHGVQSDGSTFAVINTDT